jgi:hypothetical protein
VKAVDPKGGGSKRNTLPDDAEGVPESCRNFTLDPWSWTDGNRRPKVTARTPLVYRGNRMGQVSIIVRSWRRSSHLQLQVAATHSIDSVKGHSSLFPRRPTSQCSFAVRAVLEEPLRTFTHSSIFGVDKQG